MNASQSPFVAFVYCLTKQLFIDHPNKWTITKCRLINLQAGQMHDKQKIHKTAQTTDVFLSIPNRTKLKEVANVKHYNKQTNNEAKSEILLLALTFIRDNDPLY